MFIANSNIISFSADQHFLVCSYATGIHRQKRVTVSIPKSLINAFKFMGITKF